MVNKDKQFVEKGHFSLDMGALCELAAGEIISLWCVHGINVNSSRSVCGPAEV